MKYLYSLVFIACHVISFSQTFDSGFKPIVSSPSTVNASVMQTDGKLILAGNFNYSGATSIGTIIRLNVDGSIDNTFSTGIGAFPVTQLVVQADGKILVGGSFTTFNGTNRQNLIRLNADGSPDATFQAVAFAGIYGTGVTGISLQTNNQILIRGNFDSVNGAVHKGIARLNADGTVDATLNTELVSDKKNNVTSVEYAVELASGKILIAGGFKSVNGVTYNGIARLNNDGSIDPAFDPGSGFDDAVHSMVVQTDGKAVVCGRFVKYNGTTVNRLIRINTNGSLDGTFGTIAFNAGNSVDALALQADGKILVGGNYQSPTKRIMRVSTTGAIDNTFAVGTAFEGLSANGVKTIAQGNSKVYLGGDFITYTGVVRSGFAVVSTLGALNTSIDPKLGIPGTVYASHRQSDGKVIIGGDFVYANGILVNRIARLNVNGTFDGTFATGSGMNEIVYAIRAQSDGRLLIGGSFTNYNGTNVGRMIRVTTTGALDATFAPAFTTSYTSDGVYHIHVYSNDKILISGGFSKVNGSTYKNLARLNANGTTDATFVGYAFTNYHMMDMDVRASDGAIVVTSAINGGNDLRLLDSNGNINSGFTATQKIQYAPSAVAFAPDGKILLAGNFSTYDGEPVKALIKVDDAGNIDRTFNYSASAVVGKIEVFNNLILAGQSDYYSSKGKLAIVNENGNLIDNNTPVFGNYKSLITGPGFFYASGNLINPNDTQVNGILKFTVPAAPVNVPGSLQAVTTAGNVALSWTYTGTDQLGFEIQRAKDGGSFMTIAAVTSSVTTYNDINTDPETAYQYRVKATNLGGSSGYSNTVSVTTLPDKPKAPSNLSLSEVTPIEINVVWQDNSINETEMVVYRTGPDDYMFSIIARLPANTTTYSDKFLIPNKTYRYFIRASNSLGESEASTQKTLTLSNPLVSTWGNQNNAPAGVQRTSAVAFSIGNKGYVTLGRNASGMLKDLWEYDPTTDSWTKKADFPGTARVAAVGFVVNGKAYVGTGNDGAGGIFERDFYVYDPATNQWTQVADYPKDFTSDAGISSGSAFAIGNFGYAGLGNNTVNNPKDFYRFNPVANQWEKMADFGGDGRTGAVSFSGNGKGYIGLGGVSAKYKDVWEYNPASNTWKKLSDYPSSARAGAVAFVVNNRAYIGTGDAGDLFTESNQVDFKELDLETGIWTSIPNFTGTARTSGIAMVVNNKAFVGLGASGATYFQDLKSYVPGTVFLPSKPSNLTAILETPVSSKLTWTDESNNELAFVIESSLNNTTFQRVVALDPGTTSYVHANLSGGKTYYYRIFALNAYGPSGYSTVASVSTMAPPASPLNLSVLSQFDGLVRSIKLTWSDNSSTEDGVEIHRSTDGTNFTLLTKLSSANTTTYTDSSLPPDATFYYRVYAYNAGGKSTSSNPNFTTTVPAEPTALARGTSTASTVQITWTDNSSSETGFVIYRSTGTSFVAIGGALPNVTTYTDATVSPNTVYSYVVSAKNNAGESGRSTEVQTQTLPSKPDGLVLKYFLPGNLQLNWTAVSTATYTIYRSVDGEPFAAIRENYTTTTFLDEGVVGQIYAYKIQATNTAGVSEFSDVKTIDIELITDVENITLAEVSLYPNPVAEKLFIKMEGAGNVTMFDARGIALATYEVKGSMEISMRDYHPGIYFFRVEKRGRSIVQKIVRK